MIRRFIDRRTTRLYSGAHSFELKVLFLKFSLFPMYTFLPIPASSRKARIKPDGAQ